MVETVRRSSTTPSIEAFDFDVTELQLHQHLKAVIMQCRCYSIIVSDIIAVHEKTPKNRDLTALTVDFTDMRTQCELAITEAQSTVSAREEVEARTLWAKFAAMECGMDAVLEAEPSSQAFVQAKLLKDSAFDHLCLAEEQCSKLLGSTESLSAKIKDVRGMLNSGISVSELKMVVQAMSREFGGTGHWHRCVNGHLFTIGECGRPTQFARCSSCGAGIGGRNHQPVEGVTLARDIDEQFGELHLG